jgi:DUF2891 family protein
MGLLIAIRVREISNQTRPAIRERVRNPSAHAGRKNETAPFRTRRCRRHCLWLHIRPRSITNRKNSVVLGPRIVLFAALVLLIGTGSVAMAAQVPPSLVPLLEQKEDIASKLARQAAFCVQRRDTNHPAFKGCIDWHSAVHGVWALVAYERATGNRQYSSLVSSILTKDALEGEREHLRRSPEFEMPYGRAWFLRLAIDHHSLAGSDDLLPIADEVALSMRDYYRRRTIERLSDSYQSDSWALINLLDYAQHRNLSDLEAEVTSWVEKSFVTVDQKCPSKRERGEFMAICTNWAALVSRVLGRKEYSEWLDKFIEINGLPTPISRPVSDHDFGLNFSRAWGLWDMYDKTARLDVINAYAAHLDHGLIPASNWRGSYGAVGHWVAQFGMFAVQPLFGPKAGR